MPHWLIKSGIQRFISWLPASERWNELFQTYVTRSVQLSPANFEGKLEEAARFLDRFRRGQPLAPQDFVALELGTGWYPTLPISYFLCGASAVHTFDIVSHVNRNRLVLLLDYFCAAAEKGTLQRILPSVRPDRIERLRELRTIALKESPSETLKNIQVHLKVQDACETGLPPGSVDFIFSCSVLEYIPRPVLPKLLAEFRRISSARSASVHFIHLEDQYQWFDRSIGPFNFLRYTEAQWQRLESPLISNSRHRMPDYREAFARANFIIKTEENQSGSIAELERIQLAPEFQRYTKEDLLISESTLTAIPA